MEGDDRQPAALSKQLERVLQAAAEHVQLVVDSDADRLKGLAGRMTVAAYLLRHARLDDLGKLQGSGDGLQLTRRDDALGNGGGIALLAVFRNDPAQLLN